MGAWSRIATHMELMSRMFAKTHALENGGSLTGLEPLLKGAMFRCTGCQDVEGCRQWLENAEDDSAPPAFCANASLIARLREGTDTEHLAI